MKTAISIPDALFQVAEATARRLGLSRSRLYTEAVAEYVARYRTAAVTDELNDVYASCPGRLDPVVEQMQSLSVFDEDW